MELFRLSSGDIMTATEKTFAFLSDSGVDRKDALRLQFAAEEVLLTYQQKFGEEALFELYLDKRMGTSRVVLRIGGVSFDPFGDLGDDDRLMHNLMEDMGTAPVWNYRRSYNEIVLTAGKKKALSPVAKILIGIGLGIGLGLLVRLLPEAVVHEISDTWMAPVQNAIMGFLSCLSALFIMLSVTSGVCGMGDVSTFNRVGRRMIFRLLVTLAFDAVFAALVVPVFFPLSGSGAGKAEFSTLWQMLVNIIPTNIIETFSTGNTMQIVFMAMFASTILLVMGPKAQQLVDIISQLSNLLQQLIQHVVALMPLVVFVSLFRLVADGDISQLVGAYKYPLIVALLCVVYFLLHLLIVSVCYRVPPFLLLKKLLPAMLIGFSTASSAAALSENLDTCENKLGISKQIINVGIPLGQTLYMPTVIFALLAGVLCASQIFDVEVSFSSYLILVIASYVISIAAPPVPGSLLASFALLLTQAGIPSDAMTFIVALDAIVDRFATSTYISGLQMALIGVAKSLDMLDEQKLHAAK